MFTKVHWRILLSAIGLLGFVGYLLAIFLVPSELFTLSYRVLGVLLLLIFWAGIYFILPCHSDERAWAHSYWRCYPNPGYQQLRDRETIQVVWG